MSLHDEQKSIRGILFDKDGTLIDFNSIWIPLAFELTDSLLANYRGAQHSEYRQTLLRKIGVEMDGTMIPGSIYASGTEEELADVLYHTAQGLNISLPDYASFSSSLRGKVNTYMSTHKRSIRPVYDAEQTLAALREHGLTLGISTSDNEENTIVCLEETGLLKYFHYIGCPDDVKNPKPSGDILLDFSNRFGLKPEEVAVVGDTAVDIAFAKQNHAGLAIGVLSGAGGNEELTEKADYVLPTIAGMIHNGLPIWKHADANITTG